MLLLALKKAVSRDFAAEKNAYCNKQIVETKTNFFSPPAVKLVHFFRGLPKAVAGFSSELFSNSISFGICHTDLWAIYFQVKSRAHAEQVVIQQGGEGEGGENSPMYENAISGHASTAQS